MNDKPDFRIVNSGTDAEFAEQMRVKLTEKLTELCAISDEADKRGFHIGFATAKGPIGKHIVTQLLIAKIF